MFTKYVNSFIDKDIEEKELFDIVEKQTIQEKELLEWLVYLMNKNKESVDRLGTEQFGPHSYFTLMEKLISNEVVFPMEYGDKVLYIVPRELDKYIVENNYKSVLKLESCPNRMVTFDYRYFISSILLFMHEEKKDILSQEYCEEVSSWLSQQANTLSQHSNTNLYQWLQVGYDDIFEPVAMEYMQSLFELGDSPTVLPVLKHLLYGCPIGVEQFKRMLKTKWREERVNESPFLFFQDQASVMDPFIEEEGIHLQRDEWLLPVKFQPAELWNVLQFSSVLSSGQMIHVRLESELVSRRKKESVSLDLWEKAVCSLPIEDDSDRERLLSYWDGTSPVIKKGEYIFYEITDKALREHLTKEAMNRIGEGATIPNRSGVLIKRSKILDWEEQLEAASIKLNSAISDKDEQVRVTESVAVQPHREPIIPMEWREADRLSPVSFQLMSYKENMIARLIRQSQALKLPIYLEDKQGNTYTAEIKTLQYEANESKVETYKGNIIQLHDIKRVAIVHPNKNNKGSEIK